MKWFTETKRECPKCTQKPEVWALEQGYGKEKEDGIYVDYQPMVRRIMDDAYAKLTNPAISDNSKILRNREVP